jgi:membrane protease YdiL (CAAX protease family)
MPTAPDRLRAGRAFLILGTFFGTQIVVGLLLGVGAGFYRGLQGHVDASAGAAPPAIVAQIAGVLLGALVAFHLARHTLSAVSGLRPLARIGWSLGSRRALLMAALSGFLLSAFFLMFVIPLFPPRIDRALGPLAQAATTAGWPRHAWAIFAILLAPPIEEFFFRGVLFTGISRSGGRVLSMVAVSLIFVALHVPEASAYWPALIAIGLVALATMAVRIAADSLGPAIALHAAYNSGLVLTVYSAAARL